MMDESEKRQRNRQYNHKSYVKHSAAIGRPCIFTFRVNKNERAQMEGIASLWGCTYTEVVRRLIQESATELGIIADYQA